MKPLVPLALVLLLGACSTPKSSPASTPEPAPAPAPAPPATEDEPSPTADANADATEDSAFADPVMHEPELGHAGIVEALGSSKACRSAGLEKPLRVLAWDVGDGATVYATECESFAYQSSFEWWFGDDTGFVRMKVGDAPLTTLGYPRFAPSTGVVEWLEKARGPGDCGDWYRYTRSGEGWTLTEHRRRACDAATEDIPPPSKWPVVAP